MAKWEFHDPYIMIEELRSLDRLDQIAPEMLNESAPIVVNELKSALEKHRQTGDLIRSIEAGEPYVYNGIWKLRVWPMGYSSKRMTKSGEKERLKNKTYRNGAKAKIASFQRNADKLFYLEHGSSKQPATPVVAKVVKATSNKVFDKMQEIFNREVGIK